MPNRRQSQLSNLQRMRQFAGEYASAMSQIPVSNEELQEMQSYRNYLNEVYSQEAAIRRAKRRREFEESLDYEDQKDREFIHNISRYGAEYGVRSNEPNQAKLPRLTTQQEADEYLLLMKERKTYMPDDVFEYIINKLNEDPFKPVHKTAQDLSFYQYNRRIDNPIGAWIFNTITDLTYNNYKISKQKEDKQNALQEFYNYTKDALKAAFDRYKKNHNVTDKDVQQNGKKVIQKEVKTDAERVYDALTSPEGYITDLQNRINAIKYDPSRNPDVRGGTINYYKDAITQHNINLNEAQIGDFEGRIDRTAEVVARGQSAVDYYRNLEEIGAIDAQLDRMNANGGDTNLYQQLVMRKAELQDKNDALRKNKEMFENWAGNSTVDRAVLTFTNLLHKLENKVFGDRLLDWTSPIFDDTDVLRLNLEGFNQVNSADAKQAILDKYIQARDKRVKSWQKGIELNLNDIKNLKQNHQISDYFKYWEQKASGNILDGDTWAFKQPGLMGYSNSSWIKLLPMTIGAFAAPFLKGKLVLSIAALAGSLGHSSATSENNMEVRENFIPVVQRALKGVGQDKYEIFISEGLNYIDPKIIKTGSDEEIEREVVRAYLNGIYKPRENTQEIYEATSNSTYGISALYDRDMMATDIDNIVNTAIMFGNFASLGKATKFVAPAANPISPIIGYGNAAFKLTSAGKRVYKAIDDATTFMTNIPSKIYKKAKKIAPEAFKTTKSRDILHTLEDAVTLVNHPGAKLATKTWLNGLKTVAAASIESGISEGIEEGKQYLSGQAFQRGELRDEDSTYGFGFDASKWYDDMTNGLHSAYVIAGIPFNLESTHDPELVENIKGGIMGGLFQTGMTKAAQTAFDTPHLLKLNKYMLNNVMAEKTARTDLYNKAKLYAAKAFSDQDVEYIRKRFDDMQKLNSDARKSGADWVLDQGVIEEQKQLFESVMAMAKSQDVQDRAELLGFKPGEEKYNQFIAQLALQQNLFSEVLRNKKDIKTQIINTEEFAEPVYSIDKETGKIMRKSGQMLLPHEVELKKYEDGTEETIEEAVERLNSVHAQNAIDAIRIKEIRDLITQIEISNDASSFGNSKWSKEFMLHRLKAQLKNALSYVKPEFKDTYQQNIDKLSESISNHEQLSELYRKLALALVDEDYASMMYQGLMGKNAMHQNQSTQDESPNGVKLDYLYDDSKYETTFENIQKAFENRVKGDHALYDALEQDYLERYEKLEKERLSEAKRIFMQQHPEAVEQERVENEQQSQPQSHITAIDSKTKQQITPESILKIAKKIKYNKTSSKKAIKNLFKKFGIKIDKKYETVVHNVAKLLANGDITENQFSNLFLPAEQRITQQSEIYQPEQALSESVQSKSAKSELTIPNEPALSPTAAPNPATKPQPKLATKQQPKQVSVPVAPKSAQQKTTENEKKSLISNAEDSKRFEELAKQFKSLVQPTIDNYGENNAGQIMSTVSEMMFLLVKNGTFDFYSCAKAILDTLGEPARPYLKSAYEGARFWPGAESYQNKMTSQEDVLKENIVALSDVSTILDDLDNRYKSLQNEFDALILNPEDDIIDIVNRAKSEMSRLKHVFTLSVTNKSVTDAQNAIKSIKATVFNTRQEIETKQKEGRQQVTQQQPLVEMPQLQDDQLTLWAKSALEALTFYSTKIANGLQLSQEDLTNLNNWIAVIKDQIDTIFNLAYTNELFLQLLDQYLTFVELGIDGQNAQLVDIVSVNEVQTAEEWKKLNTVHTHSLEQSRAIEDEEVFLKQFTSDKDFITNAEFEFVLGGTHSFEGPVEEGRPKKIYVIIKYKGYTFLPVAVWDTSEEDAEEENKGFGERVRQLIEQNPDKKVVPVVVKRSKGKTFKQPDGLKVSLMEAGLVNDVYSISFDNDQEEFMLTRATPVAGGKVLIRATKPNKTGKGVSAVYTYSHDSTVQTSGNVVYMMRIENSDSPLLPINVYSDTMSEGDAQLIVDIFTGKYTQGIIGKLAMDMPFILDGEYLGFGESGKTIGLTARDVLNLILPYGPFGRKGSDIAHVWHSEFNHHKIILSGKFNGDSGFANHLFDLSTVQGKEAFKTFLVKNVRKNISETIMKASLGKPGQRKDNPILGLTNFVFSKPGTELRKRLQAGEELRIGNSSIVFDWDDLGNDKRKGGITGLGWYVKRGFLNTDFAGINNALINFTGAEIEGDTSNLDSKKPGVSVAENGGTEQKPTIVLENKPEPQKRRKTGVTRRNLEKRSTETSKETRTVDEIRSILSEIIPSAKEELTVSVSEDYLDDAQVERLCSVSAAAPHVVGRCYADGIEIYKHATIGVIYHEAFHRISEIFLDDEERKKVYSRFERLYRLTHFGKKPSLEEIREGVADQFMMFMEDRTSNLGIGTTNIFKRLWNTIKFIAKIGSYGQYKLYSQVAAGRFKNFKFDDAARKRADNFANEHPEGYGFTVDGVELKYILNEHAFKELINSLVFFTFHANDIAYDGTNIDELLVTKDVIENSELYSAYTEDDSLGSLALQEAMEHFDIFAPYIVSAISEFATDYKVILEEQNAEEALSEDVSAASIEEHTHQSYEFSQFSRASSKVRFFFSRIDDLTVKEENGQVENADRLNGLGLPQFMPAKSIFNDVLNLLWDVEDLNDLMNRIHVLSLDSPVYKQIYNRLNKIKKAAYGEKYDADQEALLVQIYNIIKSNKQQFLLSQSSRYYVNGELTGYTISMQNTDMEYNARNYRFEWSNLFAHGGSIFVETGEDGKIKTKKGMSPKSMSQYWNLITNVDPSQRLGIAAAFSSDDKIRNSFTMRVNVNGAVVNKKIDAQNNKQDLDLCKVKFIYLLNCFGIQFDKAMLDYMLRQKYGSSGFDGMKQMFEETGVSSMAPVTFYMNGTYYEHDGETELNLSEDGRLNLRKPEEVFAYSRSSDGANTDSNGFFGELAKYKYQYRHSHDQLTVLAAAGNKYYVISENNYITDTVHFLNRAAKFYKANDRRMSSEIEEFDELCNFSYNLIEDEDLDLLPIGSVVLKQILTGQVPNLDVCTFSGMKSDFRGDTGVDYATISRRDDYISKLAILLGGGLIFPTMSDKKTWTFIKGIILPGINWASAIAGKDLLKFVAHDVISGQNVVDNKSRIRTNNLFSYYLLNKDEVVDQLIEYFITEHAAIAQTIADMKTLPKERRVANYHGGAKVTDKNGNTHIIIQGARHSSLLNLYNDDDELIPLSRVLDEAGNYIDEEQEWNEVDEMFFALREDEGETEEDLRNRQRIHVNRILKHRLEEELAKLEQMGLVKKTGTGNTIFDYENIGIDAAKVDQVYKAILSTYGLKEGSFIVRDADGSAKTMYDLTDEDIARFKALALATVVNDGMVKAIMSKNETERIFSGHPSFFKWGYNTQGELVDRGVDQHKRYGGLVSTGQNAALWARGINAKYRSAEIDNEMVQSQQIEFLQSTIREGSLRSMLINYLLDKQGYSIDDEDAKDVVSDVDSMKLEDVEKALLKAGEEMYPNEKLKWDMYLKLAEKQAKEKTDDFRLGNGNKGIDVADGSAYVTDTFFELMLRSIGAWDSKIERAFKILRGEEVDGKVYTIKDITTIAEATEAVYTAVIGTQKYTAYGQRMQKGWDAEDGHHEGSTLVPYYDKFALFPLFKIICTGKMAHVYKAMQDQKVDMLKIKSAIKIGMEGSKPIDWSKYSDKDGNITDAFHDPVNGFKFNVYEQRMKYLRKQFNTDPKEKEFLTMGTQMTKVVMQALTPGRMYTTQDGRTMSAKQLRDDVMKAMNEIARLGNEKFRKEFFNSDGSMNLQAFAKMIKDELSRRGASRDVIDGFTIVKENGKDVFKISPSAQSDISWIQSILASAVNKRIVDINTPGNLFIQRSIWGMEGVTHLMDDNDLPSSINGGRKLKLINEEGSMDCVLSIDYFEHIIPKIPVTKNGRFVYKTDEQGNPVYKHNEDGTIKFGTDGKPVREIEMRKRSFQEAKQWLIDNEIISGIKTGETEWNNAKSNIVGYRIPTQAVSSIHAFRCVDVLPVVRDTVIMPEEITKVTGSDFDIDKMFLSMVNYKVSGGKARDYDFLSDESEYHENRLIKDYIAMLLNKGEDGKPRNVLQLHGSIDKDTKLLTDTLGELESEGAFKERLTYQDYTLSNEVFIKQDFITGKNGIGPFALNNNNHILTMLYGVRFAKNKKSILTRLNLNRLDRTVDRDGNSILSWLSGLINAHVDIAKDPYISRLGVNPFTYNMTNLLIRTGLGKFTFYFLTLPLIMELAEAYTNSAGVYGVDRTKTTSQLRRESKQKYIVDYVNKNMGTEFSEYEYEDAIAAWEDKMHKLGININRAVDYLFNSNTEILKNISKQYKYTQNKLSANDNDANNIVIETERGHEMISMFDLQMLVFTAFEQFDPYAQALSSVVKYSKIDTKKQGKNITEQRAYRQGVYNTFVKATGLRKMFNGNLYKMYKDSYIKQKTDLALNAFDDLLSEQLIYATPQFEHQLNMMFRLLNKQGDRLTDEVIGDITDAIVQQIKSRFINDYAKRNNIDIKGLVSGDNTIFDRLVKLLIDIKTKEEYQDLLVDGEINNYLLRSLVTALQQNIRQEEIVEHNGQEDTYKNAKFVKLLNFLEDDQMDSDQLRSDWDQLLNDGTYPEIQKFARDLVVYSFITTGDVGGGMRNLFKFVPNSWKLQKDGEHESYNDYMRRMLNEYKENSAPNIDIEDLILNNWKNYNFVPTYSISRKGGFRFLTYYPEGFDFPIILSGITTLEDGTIKQTFNDDPDSEFYYPSPMYLKIKRSVEDIDESSQRMFNVYKRIGFGQYTDDSGTTHKYPIYVLVGPKGNTFNGNYKILEYGREDGSYKEVANAVAKDPLIKTLLKYTDLEYTDVESLLEKLASTLPISELLLSVYNSITGRDVKMDEVLRAILQGYKDRQTMLTDGNTVIHAIYSRATVEADPENLYIFTDNTDRTSGSTPIDENSWYAREYGTGRQLCYPSVTTAQIRGLENAYPISTLRFYNDQNKGVSGRWDDSDYDLVVETIEKELLRIQEAWLSGNYKNIILPAGDGFINALISAITEERTPKLFKYFLNVEERIQNMVENNQPVISENPTTFKPGQHPGEILLDKALDNTADLLQYISDHSEDTYYRNFVQILLQYAKDHSVKIHYRDDGEEANYAAQYHPSTDDIWVNTGKAIVRTHTEEILIHETVHSLTSRYLNDHPEDAEKIMMLAEYVKLRIENGNFGLPEGFDRYFKNAKEFITYATTDLKFREVLMQIEAMDSEKYKSIFEQLFDNIKEIIYKMLQILDPSVIKQIDPIVSRILNLQEELNRNNDSVEEDNFGEKLDIHGNAYGWSVESIGNHLKVYVEESTGYSERHRRAHVKAVNELYGTNFGVYRNKLSNKLMLKWNTISEENLNLSQNPYEPQLLELFDNISLLDKLKLEGSLIMRRCGY